MSTLSIQFWLAFYIEVVSKPLIKQCEPRRKFSIGHSSAHAWSGSTWCHRRSAQGRDCPEPAWLPDWLLAYFAFMLAAYIWPIGADRSLGNRATTARLEADLRFGGRPEMKSALIFR
jgi:hypothetical protein